MYYKQSVAKIFWLSFSTALIVSAIVSFSILYFSPASLGAKTSDIVEAPNVEHLDVKMAEMLVDRINLSFVIEEEKEDATVEQGKIIYQKPQPGTKMKKGDILRVVVSKGIPVPEQGEVIVPDVTGFELNQARVLLSKKGLNAGDINKKVSDKPEGTVVSSVPQPGKKVPEGFNVTLTVSSGPGMVSVPNLKRKSLSQARRLLTEQGLNMGSINSVTNAEYPFDIIISQNPGAGKMVKRGSKVSISITREGY